MHSIALGHRRQRGEILIRLLADGELGGPPTAAPFDNKCRMMTVCKVLLEAHLYTGGRAKRASLVMLNFHSRHSSIRSQISVIIYQISLIKYQLSIIKYQISDIGNCEGRTCTRVATWTIPPALPW